MGAVSNVCLSGQKLVALSDGHDLFFHKGPPAKWLVNNPQNVPRSTPKGQIGVFSGKSAVLSHVATVFGPSKLGGSQPSGSLAF